MKSRFFRTLAAAASVALCAGNLPAGVLGDPTSYEQARRYLGRHAADVALVAYSVEPDGSAHPADPSIDHNGDVPMPLASTIKILLLAGYAREVVAGRLDPERQVALGDWERFYLPATDGGAHPAALAALGVAADDFGFASDPDATVPLRAMVWAMIAQSDNAAADWLLEALGEEGWATTVREGGLQAQNAQLPILGQFLAWANHDRPALSQSQIDAYAQSPREYSVETWRLVGAFHDPEWRMAELHWRLAGHDPSTLWSEARIADALAPRGTARDYARVMAGVVSGTFISPEVSSVMRDVLAWPMAEPAFQEVFETFGTKGGTLSRVLTGATFAVSEVGDFTGRPRVCVLFLRRMPMLSWLSMSVTAPQQVLELGVLGNRAFTEKVRATLASGR
jgi:hypothetical protein